MTVTPTSDSSAVPPAKHAPFRRHAATTARDLSPDAAEAELRARLTKAWRSRPGLLGWISTCDHKSIGIRYLVTAFVFLLIGGVEALLIRWQLLGPERASLSPEAYNQVMTMHGTTMIWWYAAPILSGFGNYFVPLLIGSRDMAFPRLNAFSYWMFLLSGLLLYASVLFGQSPDAGWFAYVPLSSRRFAPALNLDFYAVAVTALSVSTTAGAINFIVTILGHRAPGMSVSRMPLFLYSTLTTSFLSVLALPALTVACIFLELDRQWNTHFFDASHGGDPVLWQHMFWFFGHPWVYVIFLPATGMVSMLLPVFARRPIVGYHFVASSTVLTGLVGLSVWVHHMFAVGMNHAAMSFFSVASMIISVFSTIQVFAWTATLWKGTPVRTTSLLFAVGFIASFVIGGLSGVITAVIPVDWQVHESYFVVAHLHYVLIGANLFPVMAGFYYWLPKITGRLMNERLGRWSFWLMFVGFQGGFFPMHLSGLLGMRRRVYTYGAGDGVSFLNLLTSIGAVVLAVGVLLSVWNFLRSTRRGAAAGPDPWKADSLEWATTSPPAIYAFAHLPVVRSRHPLWDEHDPVADPSHERVFDSGRQTLSTTAWAAEPRAVAQGEDDTPVPLVLSLVLTAIFACLIGRSARGALVLAPLAVVVVAAWLWPEGGPAR